MKLANFHTHTVFCDGKHTPEEIILFAGQKGFSALGFSEHNYISFDPECGMSLEAISEYRKNVLELREKYRGKIDIFLGVEQDIFSDAPTGGYDYIIGSVHYVKVGGEYVTVDWKREHLTDGVKRFFGGDIYAFCEKYYETVSEVVEKTDCDIIGHFDLVTKFNEKGDLFDETNPRYVGAAVNALDKLISENRIFEINTGAISRGYRTRPYPSEFLLRRICMAGGKVILSSDSHDKSTIDYAFSDALSLAEKCGFSRKSIEKTTEEFIEKISARRLSIGG